MTKTLKPDTTNPLPHGNASQGGRIPRNEWPDVVGMSGRMLRNTHTHTYAYHAVVVSGASKHWGNDETEAAAALQMPGDYWFQEAGQVHQDSFPTDEETILYLQFEGPIDTMFVE